MCSAGTQQSSVGPVSARQPRLDIRWRKQPETIVNRRTIQLNFAAGDTLKVGDRCATVAWHS